MRNKLFDFSKSVFGKMNAAVLNNPGEMVRQMVIPLVPQRRVKGAIEHVSRDTGLTYSKTRRLFYGLANDVWSQEKEKIMATFCQATGTCVPREGRASRKNQRRDRSAGAPIWNGFTAGSSRGGE